MMKSLPKIICIREKVLISSYIIEQGVVMLEFISEETKSPW